MPRRSLAWATFCMQPSAFPASAVSPAWATRSAAVLVTFRAPRCSPERTAPSAAYLDPNQCSREGAFVAARSGSSRPLGYLRRSISRSEDAARIADITPAPAAPARKILVSRSGVFRGPGPAAGHAVPSARAADHAAHMPEHEPKTGAERWSRWGRGQPFSGRRQRRRGAGRAHHPLPRGPAIARYERPGGRHLSLEKWRCGPPS
jgi:hypothetical protein